MTGRTVRDLLRCATTATLGTIDVATGHPYVSLVEVATLPDARPVLLLSRLARHTRNLEADPRASLLVDRRREPGASLADARATVMGLAHGSDDAACRERYLSRYAAAEGWAGFADFGFWVMQPERAHLVAGFGRIAEVPGHEIVLAGAASAASAIGGSEALATVNNRLAAAGRDERVVGIDPEGIDLIDGTGLRRQVFGCAATSADKLSDAVSSTLFGVAGRP